MDKGRWALRAALSVGAAVMVVVGTVNARAAPEVGIANANGFKHKHDNLAGGFSSELLAKAQPDECFFGVGSDLNGPIPQGGCAAGGQRKVNAAYVWGLASSGKDLWFGTAPNVVCLVFGGYLGLQDPIVTDAYTCEFGQSKWVRDYAAAYPTATPETLARLAAIGDWRASQIYVYDTATQTLTNKLTDITDPVTRARLAATMGLRSAGTLGKVVFLAGPGLQGGVYLFAFDTETGLSLGSTVFPGYTNVRKWLVVNGVLYTGVASQTGEGHILRWKGGDAAGYDAANVFSFDEVGEVGSDAAELVLHEGRIFVGTWPGGPGAGRTAGVYMSPPIPEGGFTGGDNTPWIKVWGAEQYEPDPVTAATYGGGALASFGGYLYWGTMHVPFLSTVANIETYQGYYESTGGPSQAQITAAMLGAQRAISIFRGRNFDTAPETQVVYGERLLPVFSPSTGWTLQPTKMSAPLFGHSGFGNFFNNYTWAMAVFKNRLFVGTMDWSFLAKDIPSILSGATGPQIDLTLPKTNGADLWAFRSTNEAAAAISRDGVGNYTNYGIRTTAVTPDALYLGMANPMNLLTDTTDDVPEGGWELIKVTK